MERTGTPSPVLAPLVAVVAALVLAACSSSDKASGAAASSAANDRAASEEPRWRDRAPARADTPREPPQRDDPNDPNRLVYLVSKDDRLFSFNPRSEGLGAYKLVGRLQCKTYGEPQSMSVDRHGFAWVFYDSGQLFKVSLEDASCRPTSYVHPSGNHLLGMGFTSVSPGSSAERLYVVSPDFGLSTLDTSTLAVSSSGKLRGMAELTGGGDGKLFHFESATAQLSEIDLATGTLRPVHKFEHLRYFNSFAFARYAGRFYVFTATSPSPTTTTEYDPATNRERVRDASIGFAVVGAGQSTLVPRSDGGAEVSEDFPP